MTLEDNVQKIIFSMEGFFSFQDVMEKIATEGIITKGNYSKVLDTVSEILETNIVEHVPFSDKFYIVAE